MTLTFLGTRGNIDVESPRHRRHTSTLVSYRGGRVMIDCGADWLRTVRSVNPGAIVLTHAHPDHVDGLRNGAPCPVYATAAVWEAIARWPIREQRRLRPRVPIALQGITFEPWPVQHSLGAPAVGYRIHAGGEVFYAPDVLRIPSVARALRGIDLYVGDGASIIRPIVRIEKKTQTPIGHASIAQQLEWCAKARVRRAIFTHCGTAIVAGPPDVESRVAGLGQSQGIATRVAYDGLRTIVRIARAR